jgi:ATP-dependent DNA helicase RecG
VIEKDDLEKFGRLGIQSVTALACIAPSGYEDRRILPKLRSDTEQVIDATVQRVSRTPKTLLITLYVHNFGHTVEGVLFRPKPYMIRHFAEGERHFFYGRISCRFGHCQMTHPAKVTEIGKVIPKYRTPLRGDVMSRLVRKYVTHANLGAEGLPEPVVQRLIRVHRPDGEIARDMDEPTLHALKFAELYDHMRQLRNKRRYFDALHSLAGSWKEWAETLPFALTAEQKKVIGDIENDLKKSVAARRMVVGDVGSGKTMVILASVMMARPHRAVLMAPTTILANQLYEEAKKFLPGLKTVLVTNATRKGPLEAYDFIIGTHALLYRDLPEAPLVMVDEQHRFGTAQRNMLEKLVSGEGKRPHFVQFSATPIPRTQAMIDAAHIDVSLITQTPFDKDITTEVIRKNDFAHLMEHINGELSLGHQVLIVYPLVEQSEALGYQSIEEARGFWESRFEGVHVTHGKDREKEEVLLAFRDRGTILLATTVVEVGISLPRLTTVVIVGAERLGLSTLHQLRGRVSRNGLKGYCYLFTHLSGSERLDAFVKTDSGFDIAALDLKFRQSGDLLRGSMQSGKKFRWADMAEDEEIVRDVSALVNQGKHQYLSR